MASFFAKTYKKIQFWRRMTSISCQNSYKNVVLAKNERFNKKYPSVSRHTEGFLLVYRTFQKLQKFPKRIVKLLIFKYLRPLNIKNDTQPTQSFHHFQSPLHNRMMPRVRTDIRVNPRFHRRNKINGFGTRRLNQRRVKQYFCVVRYVVDLRAFDA